jgi:putative heme iron utilization protein
MLHCGFQDGIKTVSVPSRFQGEPLFQLLVKGDEVCLRSIFGAENFTLEGMKEEEPDPLWAASRDICRHMEQDHGDTFSAFLHSVGCEVAPDERVAMPWVEKDGFFLEVPNGAVSSYVWIAFPAPCPTPNDVRKTLILMLREMREQNE